MLRTFRLTASPGAVALIALALPLLLPSAAATEEWLPAERLTVNGVEDRTTPGSLFQPCFDLAYAVWQQEQPALGWRLMWAERDEDGWSTPAPIEPDMFPDYEPRLTVYSYDALHVVWKRDSGDAAEIMYASRPYGGTWTVEAITSNSTRDLAPDVATDIYTGPAPHLIWIGHDPESGQGKVFYAVRIGASWQIERLDDSQLGPYWTGASPRISVGQGVVHVVYRGGDYGDYHIHHARRESGVWTYQILGSGNINDFQGDVIAPYNSVRVVMSGNDGWGLPSRIYLRNSHDGGLSFGPPQLISGSYSATLDNMVEAFWYGGQVIGSEVAGNIYTGNLIASLEMEDWEPEVLPPMNMASERPSGGQSDCITRIGPGAYSVLYTNHNGAGSDSAEVYFIATPGYGGVGEVPSSPEHARLRVRVAPNPLVLGTQITVEGDGGSAVSATPVAVIYDVSGRLVRLLTASRSTRSTGSHVFYWDATGVDGRPVGSGSYFLRITDGAGTRASRLVVVR